MTYKHKQWNRVYGGTESEEPSSIIATTDGGYVIAGFSFSNNGDLSGLKGVADAWVMKLDEKGNKQWSRLYGSTLGDYAKSITATGDGSYIIASEAAGNNGDFSGNHGQSGVWK